MLIRRGKKGWGWLFFQDLQNGKSAWEVWRSFLNWNINTWALLPPSLRFGLFIQCLLFFFRSVVPFACRCVDLRDCPWCVSPSSDEPLWIIRRRKVHLFLWGEVKHGGTDTEMSFIVVQRPERRHSPIKKNRRLGLRRNRCHVKAACKKEYLSQ